MIINGYEIKPGADLRGADLSGTTIHEANLSEANLRGATLPFLIGSSCLFV